MLFDQQALIWTLRTNTRLVFNLHHSIRSLTIIRDPATHSVVWPRDRDRKETLFWFVILIHLTFKYISFIDNTNQSNSNRHTLSRTNSIQSLTLVTCSNNLFLQGNQFWSTTPGYINDRSEKEITCNLFNVGGKERDKRLVQYSIGSGQATLDHTVGQKSSLTFDWRAKG